MNGSWGVLCHFAEYYLGHIPPDRFREIVARETGRVLSQTMIAGEVDLSEPVLFSATAHDDPHQMTKVVAIEMRGTQVNRQRAIDHYPHPELSAKEERVLYGRQQGALDA